MESKGKIKYLSVDFDYVTTSPFSYSKILHLQDSGQINTLVIDGKEVSINSRPRSSSRIRSNNQP